MSHNHAQCGCVHSSVHLVHIIAFLFSPRRSCIQKSVSRVSDISVLSVLTDQSEDGDQTRLVVGVIVGLLIATVVIGLAYWVYSKKSK